MPVLILVDAHDEANWECPGPFCLALMPQAGAEAEFKSESESDRGGGRDQFQWNYSPSGERKPIYLW